MAAGAGLPLLAGTVTLLHFVAVFGFTWIAHHLPIRGASVRVRVSYVDRQGALRQLLALSTEGGWTITGLRTREWRDGEDESTSRRVAVTVDLSPSGPDTAAARVQARDQLLGQMAAVAGVTDVELLDDDDDVN
jgi:putative Mg2+ transporter-C (MgtC) family protein